MNVQNVHASEQDNDLINALSRDLSQGRIDTLSQMFAYHGIPAPFLVWKPTEQDVPHPVLRAFMRVIDRTLNKDGRLTQSFLEDEGYLVLKDWIVELEPDEDLNDYAYKHFGLQVAGAFGEDMAGQKVSQLGGHLANFLISVNRAVIARQQAVMTTHEPEKQSFVLNCHRVVVPVYDASGNIYRIVVANVTDNELRAGLEILPDAVLVVSSAGELCFANRPAYALFSQPHGIWKHESLEAFTGIDFELPKHPESLVRQGHHDSHRHVVLKDGIVTPIDVTISAAFFRNDPFYVVTARHC